LVTHSEPLLLEVTGKPMRPCSLLGLVGGGLAEKQEIERAFAGRPTPSVGRRNRPVPSGSQQVPDDRHLKAPGLGREGFALDLNPYLNPYGD
jgi:hypothetical protein